MHPLYFWPAGLEIGLSLFITTAAAIIFYSEY